MKKSKLLLISTSLAALLPLFAATATYAADTPTDGAPIDSQASFAVDGTNGKLTLQSAPSFAFGTIDTGKIYGGFSGQATTTTTNALNISDTRLGTTGWSLGVSLAPFTKASSTDKLTGASLSLGATSTTGAPFTQAISDDQQVVPLATGDGTNHGAFTYDFAPTANTLALDANRAAILSQNDQYQANLTWTLTSASPTVPTL